MTHTDFIDLPPLLSACGKICLPGSKSISNRVLLLAALSNGTTEVRDLLHSDDTERMLEALRTLGVKIETLGDNAYRVTGCSGNFPVKEAKLFLGNAGTAFRPLTAALALAGGHYHLSGVPRMHERPIGDLVDALRQLGADIRYQGNAGFPPLEIVPSTLAGDMLQVRGDVSSQFLTGLLMALPLTGRTVSIEVVGDLISKPYIEITLAMMARFGVKVERQEWQRFVVFGGQRYKSPEVIFVEGDASSIRSIRPKPSACSSVRLLRPKPTTSFTAFALRKANANEPPIRPTPKIITFLNCGSTISPLSPALSRKG